MSPREVRKRSNLRRLFRVGLQFVSGCGPLVCMFTTRVASRSLSLEFEFAARSDVNESTAVTLSAIRLATHRRIMLSVASNVANEKDEHEAPSFWLRTH
jgi:hypothetical protein